LSLITAKKEGKSANLLATSIDLAKLIAVEQEILDN
jgi:hypothetical protein